MDAVARKRRSGAWSAGRTLALSLAVAGVLAGCGGGHGPAAEAPPEGTDPPPAATPLRVEAIVFDAAMTPLIVRLSKPGYTDNFRRVAFAPDSFATRVTAMLRPRDAAQPLDAGAGGRLTGRHGAMIDLPAGALVDAQTGAAVSGAVDIAMTPVDVGGDEFRVFPGTFSGIDGAGQRQLIASYGTTEFALTQGGRRLQLAPGRTATIELPIYTPLHTPGVAAGDTIALWSLDEASGDWKQEGSGTVVASAASPTGLALRATVGHFSWWNCDIPIEKAWLDLDIDTPDVEDKDRVTDDRPTDMLDNIDTDPNHYRLGASRLVHIDARTADDSLLRQAGIDFEAAFDDRSYQAVRKGAARVQAAGSVYAVARGLLMPANRLVAVTVCTQVKRGGSAFLPVEACGTATLSIAEGATLKTTMKLRLGSAQDVPYIVVQPSHKSVQAGQTATFSVDAVSRVSGSDAGLTFQWSRNGVAIPGATGPSFTTAAVSAADDSSQYGAAVTAAAGTTMSLRARLSVTMPPPPPPPPSAGDRWVDAASGNDANAGTQAAPLRSITAALAQVPRGSTVWLLDGTWTAAADPALGGTAVGLNCSALQEPISAGTTIRAVNPGRATILYETGIGICVGDTQLRGLNLEGVASPGRTLDAAVRGVVAGTSTLVSGVRLGTGKVSALGGARITLEAAGLADYGDPGAFGRVVFEAVGAGSEIVVDGGAFDRVPNANGASANCGAASMFAANGAKLVLNRVDVRSGGPRDANGIAGNAISACRGGRIELRNTTVSGFRRVSGDPTLNLGFAVFLDDGTSLLLDEGSMLSGNGVGIGADTGSTVEVLGGSIVEGSLGNGIELIGNGTTLRLGAGSIVRNSGQSGIVASANGASTISLDLAGATVSGNFGSGLDVQANVDCRVRGTTFSGNGVGIVTGQTRTCDLGTAASPGSNVFANAAINLRIERAATVTAVGNTWAASQQGADAQGRYAVPPGQSVLEAVGPVTTGPNYLLVTGARLRLAE